MAGTVTVESAPGRTVFVVDLPGEPAVERVADLAAAP